jgi:hypothetical protein
MVGSFVIPSSFARRVAKLYAVIRASSFFPHLRNPRLKNLKLSRHDRNKITHRLLFRNRKNATVALKPKCAR